MLQPTNYIIGLFLSRTIWKTGLPIIPLLMIGLSTAIIYTVLQFFELYTIVEVFGIMPMFMEMFLYWVVTIIAIKFFYFFFLGGRKIFSLNLNKNNPYYMGGTYNGYILLTLAIDFAGYILYEIFHTPNQYWEFLPAAMCLLSDIIGFFLIWKAGPVVRAGTKLNQDLTYAGFLGLFTVGMSLNIATHVGLLFRLLGFPFSFISVGGGDFITQLVTLGLQILVHAFHIGWGLWTWIKSNNELDEKTAAAKKGHMNV